MFKLVQVLEKRVGLIWAYVLLFMITWIIMSVVMMFIQVNTIASEYHKTAKQWRGYLSDYLSQRATDFDFQQIQNIASSSFDQGQLEQGLLGVTLVSGEPTRGLLKMIPHNSFRHLNVLSTTQEVSSHVITDIYPEIGVSTLFYRVDISDLDTIPLTLKDSTRRFSYAFLYTEERYFVLLNEYFTDNKTIATSLYNLDGIWVNYIAEQFQNRAMLLERESRFGDVELFNQRVYYIHDVKMAFDWSEFGIPVRYSVTVPVSWQHLDFVKIIWQASLISILLYIFLFFYNRYENRHSR